MSGRHRRPDAQAPPEPVSAPADPPAVDLAERLGGVPGAAGRADRHAGARAPVAPRHTGPSAAAPTITPLGSDRSRGGRRRDRAAERAARRARRRRQLLVGLAGVVAVALVVTAVLAVTGGPDDAAGPQAGAGATQQRTMLVQVVGADGVAVASALVGVSAQPSSAALVLVPSGLLVDVAGTGSVPFGEASTLQEPSAPAQALTDLVGVRIDDTWTMTADALARLVDSVGGVRATVDANVVSVDAEGNQTVVVEAGSQQLSGASAAAYATYLGEGEPEQARLARFDDVFTAVVAALPDDQAGVLSAVESLGEGSRSTADTAGLAARLGQLHAAAAGEEVVSDVLPVTEIDTGGGTPTYGIDSGQVAAMMRARFPAALQTDSGGESLRVLVENGVGTPGLVEQARELLVGAGFRFVNGGNAADFTGEPSSVIIPDGTEQSLRRGQRVARALGLPDSAIATSNRGQTVADVIVILGPDFAP